MAIPFRPPEPLCSPASRELDLQSDGKYRSARSPFDRSSRFSIRYDSPSSGALPPPWELSRFRRRHAVGEERRRLRTAGVTLHSYSFSRNLRSTAIRGPTRQTPCLVANEHVPERETSSPSPGDAAEDSVSFVRHKPRFFRLDRTEERALPPGTGAPPDSPPLSHASCVVTKEASTRHSSSAFFTEDLVNRQALAMQDGAFVVHALAAVHERGKYDGRDCVICTQTWRRLGSFTSCFAVLRSRKDNTKRAIVQVSEPAVYCPGSARTA